MNRMKRPGLVASFAFATVALALQQALTLWPAAADVPLSRALALAIAGVSLLGAAWCALKFRGSAVGAVTAETAASKASASPAARAAAALVSAGVCVWAVSLWARLWALAWQRPVYDWDGLYYHLPAMNGWAAARRIRWIPGLDDLPFANGYPMAAEALGFLVHRLTGTSRLVDAGNLFFWPLAALGLAVIASLLGTRGPWRWAAAGLLGAIPGWTILSATCYIDPAFAAAVIAAVAAALLFVRAPGSAAMRHALLFGGAAGLMIGCKGQGAPFFAVMLAVALAARGITGREPRRMLFAHALLIFIAAFAAGGYWPLRNVVWSGNPIFPIELSIGGRVLAPGYSPEALLAGNMPPWLHAWPAWLRVPIAWLQTDAPILGYAATGGLGFLWPFAALPAVIVLWIVTLRAGGARAPLFVLTALVALLFAIQPAPWWARMTFWLYALGIPALVALLDRWSRSGARGGAFLAPLVMLGVLAVGVHETRTALGYEWRNGRIEHGEREGNEAYLSSAATIFPGLERACPEFFASRSIARGPWSRFGTLLGGVLAQPLDARVIVSVGPAPDSAAVAALIESGTEWLVWDVVQSGPLPDAVRAATVDACVFEPEPDQKFVLARLRGLGR
jgi:hypothetical protein